MTTSDLERLGGAVDDPVAGGSTRSRSLVLVVVALAQLTVVLDVTIVNIALPAAQRDLGLSDSARGGVVTIYALAFGSLLLLGGRVTDFWGRKRSFLLGMTGFALASGLGGVATSGPVLLAARGLQGTFAALLAPAALALLSTTFPSGRERIRAFAVYGVIGGGGAAARLILGGVLTEHLSWHWCLLVNVPIAAVALSLAVPILTESRAPGAASYDVPGAVLVTAGLAALVLGLSRSDAGWGQPSTLGLVGGGIVALVAFVMVEHRTARPLLPLRIVTDRVRAGAYLVAVMVGAALLGAVLFLTFYFQLVLGMTPQEAGLASLPMTVAIICTAPLATRLLVVLGPRVLITGGPVVAAVGLVCLTFISVEGDYWIQVLPAQVVLGIGLAITFVPLQNLALFGVAERDAGVASAALTASQQIGGSAGTAVFTALYTSVATHAHPRIPGRTPTAQMMVDGYTVVFAASAIGLAAVAPVAWALVKVDRGILSHRNQPPAGHPIEPAPSLITTEPKG